MRQKSKTIVYGGAFDPPHIEHYNIVTTAATEINAEMVVLTPSYISPHKSLSTPFEHRVNMLNNIFKHKDNILVDEIEKETLGKNYTVLMLPRLKEKYGEFTYLVGGDSLLSLERWYRYEEVLKYPLAVVSRGDDRQKIINQIIYLKEKYNADIQLLDYVGKPISSGYIRGCIEMEQWQKVENAISCENVNYIIKHGLYKERAEIIKKAFDSYTDRLKTHTINTVLTALSLNTLLGLPYEKVFLSALLHDIAKHNKQSEYPIPKDAKGTAVEHQFVGAIMAEREFMISDNDILTAIKYHSTSTPNATMLTKLIYCADMLEEGRIFDGVNELRELAYNSFEMCYNECVKHSYNFLISQKAEIFHLTTETYRKIKMEECK